MKNKLIYKFIFGVCCALITSFLFTSIIVSSMTYKHQLKKEAATLYQEASSMATNYALAYFHGSMSLWQLKSQMHIIDSYFDSNILLISAEGNIITGTYANGNFTAITFDPTNTQKGNYIIGTLHGFYNEDHLSVFYPIQSNYSVKGYVIISKPISIIKTYSNQIFNFNYLTMFLTFVLCTVVSGHLVITTTIPIKKLTKATNLYAKGDFAQKIEISRSDEIGQLSDSLNYMASEINDLTDYQKKIIANVSHDFRSPLTSIKGYLEAILDGTIPPEMQGKYLGIVISETERLTKLTNNLLTLNNVNSEGMVLDITEFDIVEIIKHTIETNEGICEKKRIKFKLVLSDKKLYVTADQGKIQQVISNLVDNAIKFSNPDSSIIISASEKGEKVRISVKDFGIGIPKESLSKIFERFYKSDLSRGKDKKGTGLGLSIVKDIITAHKEYIDVVSTEGVGSEFTFALPLAKKDHESY